MNILGIIPSRYGSTRLPGKALADIGGKPMVQHVFERASRSELLSQVIIATDDERIKQVAEGFGAQVEMTDPTHESGTDRCHEALRKCGIAGVDAVINIQGDEPFIDPAQIDQLAKLLMEEDVQLATLVQSITDLNDLADPAKVKVVLDDAMNALYFSRAAIPFVRDKLTEAKYFKHIGLYGYQANALARITGFEPSMLEKAEALEQLRWLQHGMRIRVALTTAGSTGVDTPADLENARDRFSSM